MSVTIVRVEITNQRKAACICEESGKTIDDANSEVLRGIDMIEAASSLPSGILGGHLVNESTETHTVHEPLVSSLPFDKNNVLTMFRVSAW